MEYCRREAKRPSNFSQKVMHNAILAAAIAAALRKVMHEEGVATKTDLEKFGATLEHHEQKMDSLEKHLEALEKQETWIPAPGTPRAPSRPSTGSRSSSAGRASSARTRDTRERTPGIIHIKGFAPFGCDASKKLRKGDAENALQDLYGKLDAELRAALSPMPTYAINHSLSMRVVSNHDPWETARKLDELIQHVKWTIKSCRVNARAEQSATRKKSWSMYYQRLQNIKESVGED